LVINEVTVVGSRCGLFAPALKLLSDPSFETEDLIEALYPLDQAIEAFRRSQMPDSMKVLIGMDALDIFSGFPPHIIKDYTG
jgi:threonine dehydrogenase-like Zn-dependent dehydrogenase